MQCADKTAPYFVFRKESIMIRLFVDMDGTLARFHDEVSYLERMFEENFFLNLKPFENAVEAVNRLAEKSELVDVYILSAAIDGEPPYCIAEKNKWIDEHLPNVDSEHRIFTKVGVPKEQFIEGGIESTDILWDDYNKNLDEWEEAGGIAVKCHNNINHKGKVGKLWDGSLLSNSLSADKIVSSFEHCADCLINGDNEDENDEDFSPEM